MTINSAAEFLKPPPREYRDLDIPGIGSVRIQKLRKSELCEWQKWFSPAGKTDPDRYANQDLWLVAASVVDENGKTFLSVEDIDKLGDLDGEAMNELCYEVLLFNGFALRRDNKTDDTALGESES